LIEVGQHEVLEADPVRFPLGVRLGSLGHSHEKVAMPLAVTDRNDAFGGRVGIPARSDEEPVLVEKCVDVTSDANASVTQKDEVVADAFELGDDVRGQQYGEVAGRDGVDEGLHEVPAREGVETGYRFVEDEQSGPFGQRQGKSYLGLLSAGELAGSVFQWDVQLFESVFGEGLVPAGVEGTSQVQQVGDGEGAVEGVVLGDEPHLCQPGRPVDADRLAVQAHDAFGGAQQADC
jgi:hypothetical protein